MQNNTQLNFVKSRTQSESEQPVQTSHPGGKDYPRYNQLSDRTRFQIEILPRLNKQFPRATLAEKLKICQELYDDRHRSDISSDINPVYRSKG